MRRIDYVSYLYDFKEGRQRMFLFYPDGEWDEDKMVYSEAIKRYPKTKYKWNKVG